MKVQLADREIWIEFAYQPGVISGYNGDACHITEVTACLLRDASAPRGKNEPAPLLVRGEVSRYAKDPPNRELARKAALAKALERLDRTLPYQNSATLDQDRSNHLLKARRKLFWDAYLHRKPHQASPEERIAELAPRSPPSRTIEQALRDIANMPGNHCCLLGDGDQVIEQYECTCWRSVARAALGDEPSMQSRVLPGSSNPPA